ncbi:MAG TPA: hypothetical protein VIY27_06050 [Myxococcota bacterium]
MGKWQIRLSDPGGGAGPTPPGGTDRFAPRVIVGNVPAGDPIAVQAAPFEYIGDTGNGAGIAAAIASVTAAGAGGWIHIRRGLYDLGAAGAPVLPMTIAGFRVTGDGCSTLLRLSTLDRRLFIMASGPGGAPPPELCHLGIDWTTAAAGAVGTECVDALGSFRAVIENVEVIKDGSPADNPDEPLTSVFRGGLGSRFLNARTVNVDGNAGGAGVVSFRLAGTFAAAVACAVNGSNTGYRLEAAVSSLTACTHNGGVLAASSSGVRVAAPTVTVTGCMVTSSLDGIVVESSGGATLTTNAFGIGLAGDGIRIEAGATSNIVLANRLNGNSFLDLGTLTESAHNTP